jgi:hypothetical protein
MERRCRLVAFDALDLARSTSEHGNVTSRSDSSFRRPVDPA